METTPEILGRSLDYVMSLAPKVRSTLLSHLVRWERYDEALPLARALAEDQGDSFKHRSTYARVLSVLGRAEEAAPIVSELSNLHPRSMYALGSQAELAMALGDLPEALKYCYLMVEVCAESVTAWRGLARVYLEAGQLEKAHANCRKALDIYKSQANPDSDSHPHVVDLRILERIYRLKGDNIFADDIESQLEDARKRDEVSIQAIFAEAVPVATPARKHRAARGVEEENVPEPEARPAEPVSEDVRSYLKSVFCYDNFRVKQEEVVSRAMAGEDQLVIMPTGSGKSLCYQLPAALGKRVVVISPLIALMKDQLDGLPSELASRATLVNSSIESDELERRLNDITRGRYNLIYAAPERLRQAPFLHALRRAKIDLFVVDEVHCVSIWGHDFRPDYLFIAQALEMIGSPPFLGMTATAGPEMRREIKERIGKNLIVTSAGTYRPNLILQVKNTSREQDKVREIERICRQESGCGIIYVNSRQNAEDIAFYLKTSGVDAGYYHAGMQSAERTRAQESFMIGKLRVMAATVAFGMGVDKPDVRFVIHFALPKSVENYYQEAGRAGRDGKPSRCVLLYSPSDKARLTGWMNAEALSVENVRSVYETLRRVIPQGGAVHEDDIIRESGFDERIVRVAVSLLERVGLIRRGLDVPTTLTLRVTPDVGWTPEFGEFVERARLRRGQKIALGLAELSARTGVLPHQIEGKLLEWRDEGVITCRASGRTMFIEYLNAGHSAKRALAEMLETHLATSAEKIDRLAAYAKTKRCRHWFISRHFGESIAENCGVCDNCAASSAPNNMGDEHILILRGIDSLPVRMAVRGLVKALVGAPRCPIQPHEWAHLGALSHHPTDRVEKLIGDLLAWGYIERDGNIIRPVLTLSMAGRRLVHGEVEGEPLPTSS